MFYKLKVGLILLKHGVTSIDSSVTLGLFSKCLYLQSFFFFITLHASF